MKCIPQIIITIPNREPIYTPYSGYIMDAPTVQRRRACDVELLVERAAEVPTGTATGPWRDAAVEDQILNPTNMVVSKSRGSFWQP